MQSLNCSCIFFRKVESSLRHWIVIMSPKYRVPIFSWNRFYNSILWIVNFAFLRLRYKRKDSISTLVNRCKKNYPIIYRYKTLNSIAIIPKYLNWHTFHVSYFSDIIYGNIKWIFTSIKWIFTSLKLSKICVILCNISKNHCY